MDRNTGILICLFLGLSFLLGASIFYMVGIAVGRALGNTIPYLTMFLAMAIGAYMSTVKKEIWNDPAYRILWIICAIIFLASLQMGWVGWDFFLVHK